MSLPNALEDADDSLFSPTLSSPLHTNFTSPHPHNSHANTTQRPATAPALPMVAFTRSRRSAPYGAKSKSDLEVDLTALPSPHGGTDTSAPNATAKNSTTSAPNATSTANAAPQSYEGAGAVKGSPPASSRALSPTYPSARNSVEVGTEPRQSENHHDNSDSAQYSGHSTRDGYAASPGLGMGVADWVVAVSARNTQRNEGASKPTKEGKLSKPDNSNDTESVKISGDKQNHDTGIADGARKKSALSAGSQSGNGEASLPKTSARDTKRKDKGDNALLPSATKYRHDDGKSGTRKEVGGQSQAGRRWMRVRGAVKTAAVSNQIISAKNPLKKYVFDPRGTFMRFWDALMMVMLIYTATWTPFEVAYLTAGDTGITVDGAFVTNRIVDVFFFIDILVQFLTARVKVDGSLVTDHKIIAREYAKSWLLLDVVSIIPFDIIAGTVHNADISKLHIFRVLRLLKLTKITRLLRSSGIVQRWEAYLSVTMATVRLAGFVITIMTAIHWFACAYRLVIDLEAHGSVNWVVNYFELTSAIGPGMTAVQAVRLISPADVWLVGLMWSTQTIVTVGYGDVPATTPGERILVVICMLMGGFIFAYIVGSVCSTLQSMDKATSEFYAELDDLNRYMHSHHLPPDLCLRLKQYFYFAREMHRERHYHVLLEHMSPHLRGEVASHINSQWILKVPFFACNDAEETRAFITQIAMAMVPEAYGPRELIIKQGETANKMYIIQKGVVSRLGRIFSSGSAIGQDMILTSKAGRVPLSDASVGDPLTISAKIGKLSYGTDRALDVEYHRSYSVRALMFVSTMCLTRSALDSIFEGGQFPTLRDNIRRAAIRMSLLRAFVHCAKLVKVMRQVVPNFSIASPQHLQLLDRTVGENFATLRKMIDGTVPIRCSSSAVTTDKSQNDHAVALTPPTTPVDRGVQLAVATPSGNPTGSATDTLASARNPPLATFVGDFNVREQLNDATIIAAALDAETRYKLGDVIRLAAEQLGINVDTPWLLKQPSEPPVNTKGRKRKSLVMTLRKPDYVSGRRQSINRPATVGDGVRGRGSSEPPSGGRSQSNSHAAGLEDAMKLVSKEMVALRQQFRNATNTHAGVTNELHVVVSKMSDAILRLQAQVQEIASGVENGKPPVITARSGRSQTTRTEAPTKLSKESPKKLEDMQLPAEVIKMLMSVQGSAKWMVTIAIIVVILTIIQFIMTAALVAAYNQ